MAEKLTVSQIRELYEAIVEENKTLPNFDEVDFETKWMVIELNRRLALGISTEQGAGEGKTIEEQIDELITKINATLAYDQAGFFVGKPENEQKLFSIPVARKFVLPENCLGSQAKVAIAPHASATFSIKKNGFQIGTFTFGAGVTNATFVCDETIFEVGDVLEIYSPTIKDSDLSDPCWNFKINLEIT
jgi:hypothetical protein